MMQKNEKELLDIWVQYHASLFGYENLYIFDNGSDIDVQAKLKVYIKQGVNVDFSFSLPKDFENKGEVIGELIKKLDKTSDYDFYFPLDCDEFLGCVDDGGSISCERDVIQRELFGLVDRKELLMINQQLFNHPASKIRFWFRSDRKCFFRKNTFHSLDVGFHWGKNVFNGEELRTNIVQFHFHNKPFDVARTNAREKLKLRVPNFELETMRLYKGAGCHLTKYFLLDEKSYLVEFNSIDYKNVTGLSNKFEKLGIRWPYEDTLNRALSILRNIDECVLSIHNLSLSGENKIEGWVDDCSRSEKTFSFFGWAINKDELSKEPLYVHLLVNNSTILTKKIDKRLERPDVSRAMNISLINSGFVVTFDVDSIQFNLRLFVSVNDKEIGWELPFGKAATRFLEQGRTDEK